MTDRAARLCGLRRGMSVIDMCCGEGATARFLANKYGVAVTAIEVDAAMYERCMRAPPHTGVRYALADARTADALHSKADAVFIECALSVMDNPGAALRRARAALRTNGGLVVSDVYSKVAGPPWGEEELRRLIESAGFDITISEDHTPALLTYAAQMRARGQRARTSVPAPGYILIIASAKETSQ
jgi:ubiquinone/menaquinone biosynthesis C-methylase UbiE